MDNTRSTPREDDPSVQLPLLARQVTRRMLLGTLGGGATLAATALLLDGCGSSSRNISTTVGTPLNAARQQEVDVFNFALNLEYLEAEAYSYALNGTGISPSLTTGTGTTGSTTGGQQVNFTDSLTRSYTQDILNDELHHIELLKSAITGIGGQPIAKPAINLNALGVGFGSDLEFIALSRAFTDTGTSAYAGSANLITEPDLQETSGRILSAEGYHAGNIRLQYLIHNVPSLIPPLDSQDQPPATNNYFDTDTNSLCIARTAPQVAVIIRGTNPSGGKFFPNGLNGNIR